METSASTTTLRTAPRSSAGAAALTRRTGLSLPPDFPLAEWKRFGKHLYLIADSSSWWLGDWIIFGQDMYPGRYRQAMEETGLDYKTLRNYAWIARRFTAAERHPKVSFQHHAEVASLEPAKRAMWLERATQEGWSRNTLRQHVRQAALAGSSDAADEREGKQVQLQVRTTAERETLWAGAAERDGRDLAEWIISSLDRAATRETDPARG
ncbi:LmbU family transcriptional regulator [Streptomyces sp. NBC_01298]|uniref:LmbU family transcriptional regulator n=1 Tax=Streptomyces sp. NBC_01298 TaxID=2903817 RepID=UPI002E1331B8|nr:LmbU family transcriptional regulator [Streptomyces sp. NBC_01298]